MYNSIISFFNNKNSEMKAFKIQDLKRETRIGITANNLSEILQKGKQKLKISNDVQVTVVLEKDGTEVTSNDYLKTLDPQTVLVFLKPGESWMEAGEQVYHSLNKLYNRTKQTDVVKKLRELMSDEKSPEKISIISHYLDQLQTDPVSEERHEHEDWFEGVDKKFNKKSDFMRNAAQQRIRSYYTSAKDQIKKENDPCVKACLDEVMNKLNEELKRNKFHGDYFDRTASKNKICDKKGWFTCEGAFDEGSCSSFHKINPYASRGFRHMFGLWNLDHIVEKSREVIPKLIKAAQNKRKAEDINFDEVYKYLFKRDNLRLVYIGCHKKAAREQTISFDQFYVSRQETLLNDIPVI
ncbi:unnamed protein product [Lymnaea stagnalis]|uniref:CIDE-N domain-containing protein n=1 Tax=Lymnaea stagnalis TaxID=6523 RepID=A0AAV2HDJ4_LYMST